MIAYFNFQKKRKKFTKEKKITFFFKKKIVLNGTVCDQLKRKKQNKTINLKRVKIGAH